MKPGMLYLSASATVSAAITATAATAASAISATVATVVATAASAAVTFGAATALGRVVLELDALLLGQDGGAGQAHLAVVQDFQAFHLHGVAQGADIGDLFHALQGQLGDMHQAFNPGRISTIQPISRIFFTGPS